MTAPETADHREAAASATQKVRRYLRFLGCPEAFVDDLAQEAMLAGLRRAEPGDPPQAWLFAVARNQLRKALRDRGRKREVADLDRLDDLWSRHVVDDGDKMRDALRACLDGLPARSREVLELHYGAGRSRAQISAQVGLKPEGVKSLLARLRAALAECVQKRTSDD